MRYFRERRIRKTREKIAYWRGRSDMYRQLCSGKHFGWERNLLVDAYSNQKKYESRLESLTSNNKE
jgi:hypothetical protein